MTLKQITIVALSPEPRTKRERQQVERAILQRFATDEQRRVYKEAAAFNGYTLWDFLREILARAYESDAAA